VAIKADPSGARIAAVVQITPQTRAVVTGASRGIGRALTERLAARGATVGLAARSAPELSALADALPAPSRAGGHPVLACDVGDRASVAAALSTFIDRTGGLELIVANAGVAHYGPFRDQSSELVERMTRINWLGTVHTVAAALEHMLDRGEGHVVIVASGAALRSFPWAAVYGATKAAQRGFGEALRHELSGTGVSLTMVYPGEIGTSLHDHEQAMPDWYRGGADASPASKLAARTVRAVERDQRALYYPGMVRVMGVVHGVSPRLGDHLLAALRGGTAAPRRD